jgi:hypothetical protein
MWHHALRMIRSPARMNTQVGCSLVNKQGCMPVPCVFACLQCLSMGCRIYNIPATSPINIWGLDW